MLNSAFFLDIAHTLTRVVLFQTSVYMRPNEPSFSASPPLKHKASARLSAA